MSQILRHMSAKIVKKHKGSIMKKLIYVLLVVFMLFGCGDDSITPDTNKNPDTKSLSQ